MLQDWASDIVGSNNEDAAFVMAQGNIIRGNAIPVKTPYMDRAVLDDIPLSTSICGNWMVSIVFKILMKILFKLKGVDSLIIEMLLSIENNWQEAGFNLWEWIINAKDEKNEDDTSPKNIPRHTKESDILACIFCVSVYSM